MAVSETTFEQVLNLARRLPPADQARLVARLAPTVEQLLDQTTPATSRTPHIRLRGSLTDLGPAPSAADIEAIQRETWGRVSLRVKFDLSRFLAIIALMFYLTPNTILICTATRGPIAAFPCRIASRDG